jgi:hypothetical protein
VNLGSARASRADFGGPRRNRFWRYRSLRDVDAFPAIGEGANRSTRGACAPQNFYGGLDAAVPCALIQLWPTTRKNVSSDSRREQSKR